MTPSRLRSAPLAALLLLTPVGLSGQADVAGESEPRAAVVETPSGDTGFRILGRPAQRRRLIGGMWTLHPYAISFPRVEETHGYGLQWGGAFAATFVNSYGDRAFTAGVERVWGEVGWRFLSTGLGYRAGVVTGYDERLLPVAEDLPVLPFVGIMAWTRVGPARFDVFYVYRVVTLEVSLHLW